METTSTDGTNSTAQSNDINWRDLVACATIAELTIDVISPALNTPEAGQGAAMLTAYTNSTDAAA